jgi:hypothetical protein
MPGKTPMWGNPTREREREILLFSFRKVHNSSKITFPAKRNHLQHPNCPTKICLDFCAKSVLLYDPPRNCSTSKTVPTACCTDCSVWPNNSKNSSKTVPSPASIFVPFPLAVRTVRIRTVRPPTTENSLSLKT